jgi:predicted methyltransferase
VRRGNEAVGPEGVACIVVADDPSFHWTRDIMKQAQSYLFSNGFVITELVPQFHRYHLDDAPNLTSCSLFAVRYGSEGVKVTSDALQTEDLENFYGACAPLRIRYVRDLRNGGKLASKDHRLEPLVLGGFVTLETFGMVENWHQRITV